MSEQVIEIDLAKAGPADLMLFALIDRTERLRGQLASRCDRRGFHALARSIRDTSDPEELVESAVLDAGSITRAPESEIRQMILLGSAAGFLQALVQEIGMVSLAPNVDDTYADNDTEEVVHGSR